jgi:hypothetical protein
MALIAFVGVLSILCFRHRLRLRGAMWIWGLSLIVGAILLFAQRSQESVFIAQKQE